MGFKEALYKPFEEVDKRQGRGGYYDYIKWRHVADRMNEVFDGKWSSEVVSEITSDTEIVIRVAVSIMDANNQAFTQEGYGGAAVRQGEEPGTAYKSAYSKALKDACRKWGVGLYLDGDGSDATTSTYNAPAQPMSPPTGVSMPAPISQPSPVQQPAPIQQPEPVKQPAPVQQEMQSPSPPTPPVTNTGPAPVQGNPSPPAAPSSIGTGMPAPISMGTNAGMAPPAAVTNEPPAQTQPATQAPAQSNDASPDEPGTLTEVQKMAIKHMGKTRGLEDDASVLANIVNVKESGLDRQVNSLEDLSYIEAVAVIKYIKVLNESE